MLIHKIFPFFCDDFRVIHEMRNIKWHVHFINENIQYQVSHETNYLTLLWVQSICDIRCPISCGSLTSMSVESRLIILCFNILFHTTLFWRKKIVLVMLNMEIKLLTRLKIKNKFQKNSSKFLLCFVEACYQHNSETN